jgi:NhaP-type Na+/H+ or K+/H+ antiporter
MGQKDTIFILVFGESLLNDGIAITMFNAFCHQYKSGLDFSVTMALWVIFTSILICIGSIVLGLAFGYMSMQYFKILRGAMSPVSEVISFFLWSLIPYYTSDALGLSGIVTIVVMGFFMDIFITSGDSEYRRILRRSNSPGMSVNYSPEKEIKYGHSWDTVECEKNSFVKRLSELSPVALSQEADIHIRFVSHVFARIFENAIFIYLGLFLLSDRYNWNVKLISISIVSCLLSRAIMVVAVSGLLWLGYNIFFRNQCNGVTSDEGGTLRSTIESLTNPKTLLVMVVAGLRGAVSLALVESIPTYDAVTRVGSAYKPEIKAMTCATIIFTVYFLGGSAFYVLRSLNINGQSQQNSALQSKLLDTPRRRLDSVA